MANESGKFLQLTNTLNNGLKKNTFMQSLPFTQYNTSQNPLGHWTSSTIPFDPRAAAGDGYYEFYTVAVDRASNVEAPPATPDASVTIDTVAPTLTVTSPTDGQQAGPTVNVEWQATDGLSGVDRYEVSLDGGSFVAVGSASSYALSGVDVGSHSVTVRAYDRAGNHADVSVAFSVAPTPPFPWLLLAIILAAVVAGLLLLLWWKRRKDREDEETEIAALSAAAQTEKAANRNSREGSPADAERRADSYDSGGELPPAAPP